MIHETINASLTRIEAECGVTILYACESGSRAWGLAGPESDYDVRFLFIYPRDRYLQLDDPRDVIEIMETDRDLDLMGWDLRKALRLLRKSNPSLLEWLRSPIVYRAHPLRDELLQVHEQQTSIVSLSQHYLHMANSQYIEYIRNVANRGELVAIKKYLYVLIPLARLIVLQEQQTLPSMLFTDMLANITLPPAIRSIIDDMIARKISGVDMGRSQANAVLDQWIEEQLAHFATLPVHEGAPAEITPALDALLLRYIG